MRILIVDDEAPARQRLARMLDGIDGMSVVGQAGDGIEALEQIARLVPDLVFLDIEMPGLTGLEVAQTLGNDAPAIVFATAYDQFALDAFEVSALDYLVKPISKDRLLAAIEKAEKKAMGAKLDLQLVMEKLRGSDATTRFAVRIGSAYEVVDPKEIAAIVARDNYSAILFQGRELLSEETLDALERRLDGDLFLRVHRSGIINLSQLARLERLGDRKYEAVLSDPEATRVPISRERLKEIKARLDLV